MIKNEKKNSSTIREVWVLRYNLNNKYIVNVHSLLLELSNDLEFALKIPVEDRKKREKSIPNNMVTWIKVRITTNYEIIEQYENKYKFSLIAENGKMKVKELIDILKKLVLYKFVKCFVKRR